MVDAVDLALFEDLMQGGVKFARCLAVAAEGLFDDEAGRTARFGLVETDIAEGPGHNREDLGDGGEVIRAVGPDAERFLDLLEPALEGGEGVGVRVLTRDVGAVFYYFRPAGAGVGH